VNKNSPNLIERPMERFPRRARAAAGRAAAPPPRIAHRARARARRAAPPLVSRMYYTAAMQYSVNRPAGFLCCP
jgi:hypothetical protein